MILKSKFSDLFLAKFIFFTPICVFAIIFSIVNYFNEKEKMSERLIVLLLASIMLVLLIQFTREVLSTSRIVLDDEKITLQNIITGRLEFFHYTDIAEVGSKHERMYLMRNVPMNDGFHYRNYRMNDGRILELSPAIFDNYGDLVYTISEYTSHLK
jgi:hypothetical protein